MFDKEAIRKSQVAQGSIPQQEYEPWILLAIYVLNGSASKQQVLDVLRTWLSPFTQEDLAYRDTREEATWENKVAWQRDQMVKSGLLLSVEYSGHNNWVMSPVGEAALRRLLKTNFA